MGWARRFWRTGGMSGFGGMFRMLRMRGMIRFSWLTLLLLFHSSSLLRQCQVQRFVIQDAFIDRSHSPPRK